MPGYRSLSTHLSGTAADSAREAEEQQRSGDVVAAARLLEEALESSARVRPEIPGWLCGRLASIYRTLKRYDDEVELLERYRESQTSEDARTRFDARLSKARAIADRKRRPETGALATVRQVRDRSKGRRASVPTTLVVSAPTPAPELAPEFSPLRLAMLSAALSDTSATGGERLRDTVAELSHEGKSRDLPMESLVAALKTTWKATPAPRDLTEEQWRERYAGALVDLLAFYFGESQSQSQ
jgi:hypothetical protein